MNATQQIIAYWLEKAHQDIASALQRIENVTN